MKKENRLNSAPLLALGLAACGAKSTGRAERGLVCLAPITGSANLNSPTTLTPLLAFTLAACGGGGSSSSSASSPPANTPPPLTLPNEIPLALYENHPTNKAVYDATPQGQSAGEISLAANYGDNDLFHLTSDGRIWWNASPDYENRQDADDDGTYLIRINHPHNARGYTEIEVEVGDVAREITPQQWREAEPEHKNDYFEFTYEQVTEILPDNDLVKYIIDGFGYAMPATGPLILTWSIVLPDSDIEPIRSPGSTNTQTNIDRFRSTIEDAFDEFEGAANVKFIEVSDTTQRTGDIRFHFDGSNANGSFSLDRAGLFISFVRLNSEAPYFTYVHEIGHVLGLKHPHETTNSDAGFPFDPELRNGPGSERTIMSVHPARTSMEQADIDALQFLYGAPGTDFDGLQARLEEIGITPEIIL